MLVLSRKKDESIMIGENIEIVIVDIDSNNIKIGIKAPKDLEILRKELFLSIQEETKKSAQSTVDMDALKQLLGSKNSGRAE